MAVKKKTAKKPALTLQSLRKEMTEINHDNARSFNSLSKSDSFIIKRIDELEDKVDEEFAAVSMVRREVNSRLDDYELTLIRQRKRMKADRLIAGLVIAWNIAISAVLAYSWELF